MINYAANTVFSDEELELLKVATSLVDQLDRYTFPHAHGTRLTSTKVDNIRCHDLARALGAVLELKVVDGVYGPIEHSWLLTNRRDGLTGKPLEGHNILDVYRPGQLPQVQLIHDSWQVPDANYYKTRTVRTDIDEDFVAALATFFRSFKISATGGG